jgi:Ion channel
MSGTQSSQATLPTTANKSGATRMIVYLCTIGGVFVYFVTLILTLLWNQRSDINEPGWASVLFALPVVAQVIGAALFHARADQPNEEKTRFFYRFSMLVSFAGIVIYCGLWLFYAGGLKSYIIFSGVALGVIACLIGMIGIMMYAFMHEQDVRKSPKLSGLRIGAANEPLWALSFLFLVIFLDVSYLFGFALAFHDNNGLASEQKLPALRMTYVDSPDEGKAASDTVGGAEYGKAPKQATVKAATSEANGGAAPAGTTAGAAEYYFYFDSGKAHLDSNCPSSILSMITNKCDVLQSNGKPLERADWMDYDYRAFNYCSLERIKKRIEQETGEGRRTRIILLGRSDSQPIGGGKWGQPNDNLQHYKSNYELSEARVQNVRYEIVEGLKKQDEHSLWHNLEWLTLPSSDEESKDDKEWRKRNDDLESILNAKKLSPEKMNEIKERNKRVVIASILPIPGDITSKQMIELNRPQFRRLNLMDYMYFSIYTITTTGYGDIVPTTAYSKFVISIANICEVLFLVVFFNALVSIRGEKRKEQEEDKKKQQDKDEKQSGNEVLDLS